MYILRNAGSDNDSLVDDNDLTISTTAVPELVIPYFLNQAVVWWPPSVMGWTLQTDNKLTSGTWANYTGAVRDNRVTNSPPPGNMFFLLA